LLNLVYRDQLFPRTAFRNTWDALVAAEPPRIACRIMVGLLALVRERACEAELADQLELILAAGERPDLDALQTQFAPASSCRRIKPTPERLRMPDSGSLRALCVAYFASVEHKRMEPRSRHVRRSILDKLCGQYGDKPAGRREARRVRQVRVARSDALEAANGIVKVLRAVYRNGMLADLVSKNPARNVEHLRSGTEGLHTWTAAEVQLFEAHHPIGTNARLALALLLYPASGDQMWCGLVRSICATVG